MQISSEMISLIREKFESSDSEAILSAVETLDEQDFDDQDPDRIAGAIAVLAKRNMKNLSGIIQSAETDWRDLLLGAGIADEDWPLQFIEIIASWRDSS